ncbi:MAG: sulfite exporter TauE/SafE family protein [Ideonella sp.]|nr:sulfite exporter TauE/SafE family protein [Ideonella sp.]
MADVEELDLGAAVDQQRVRAGLDRLPGLLGVQVFHRVVPVKCGDSARRIRSRCDDIVISTCPPAISSGGARRRAAIVGAARRRTLAGAALLLLAASAHATGPADAAPWWVWPLALGAACFLIGIVAVPAGIGGGTLFVPIVGSFFPFHLDFVRGAGLLVALASALSAGPTLLRSGLGSLRLALPMAVLASASSIVGAMVGLAMPVHVVQLLLGAVVLAIALLMFVSKRSEFPHVERPDRLARALALHGVFVDGASQRVVQWQVHRTAGGLVSFLAIGVLAGMFGIGAGWANVPALNLLMGAPLKVAAGTSGVVLSLVDSSAAWVYLNQGAVLPMIAVPSILGMMAGARIGARLLTVLRAAMVRRLVIAVLLFAGVRALLKGAGVWP